MNNPLDPKLDPENDSAENLRGLDLRPQNLDNFIGQEKTKDNLKIFIEAAQRRVEPLDHILFHGPPGLGKTTLARIIANEMGTHFRSTSGPVISKAGDLAAILTSLEKYDVLFIDEIHRLSPAIEEILYPAMEDFKLDILIGEGAGARSIEIALPPFTLIAATTRAGLITKPLRERFGIPLQLEFYEEKELAIILTRAAQLLGCPLSSAGASEIAKRSRFTPRIALRLLRRIRDFWQITELKTIDDKTANDYLNQLDIDDRGLDRADRDYLTIIAKNFSGGPVGVETIAAAISTERDILEEMVEPYLMRQGFLKRTPRGRILTEHAYHYLSLPTPLNFHKELFDHDT